jgi:adenosylcobinamide-phosphate synthase
MTGSDLLLASTAAIALGALADRVVGDPRRLPHVVRGMGRLIAGAERHLLPPVPLAPVRARRRGLLLVLLVLAIVALPALVILGAAYALSPWLGAAVETQICCQCLAVKSLRSESMKVAASLDSANLNQARRDVSMIVGRDTADLDAPAVARAAVETVAENTSDAVVAPLTAMLIAGGWGALVYKAVNTLDSMIGYNNSRYVDYGRAAARLDDWANWLPSRLAAGLMILAAALTGVDPRSAARIWRRDRHHHTSPNSGQSEAACAGALHIELGGPVRYAGQADDKPPIGDSQRPIGSGDIASANRLMSATGWLALGLVVALRLATWGVINHATR